MRPGRRSPPARPLRFPVLFTRSSPCASPSSPRSAGGHRRLGKFISDTSRTELDVTAEDLKKVLADRNMLVAPLDEEAEQLMPPPAPPPTALTNVGDLITEVTFKRTIAELNQKIEGLAGAKSASEAARASLEGEKAKLEAERNSLAAALGESNKRMDALEAKLNALSGNTVNLGQQDQNKGGKK
jgi:septal ring factor EnvC (AmiA/AmiB activator)